MQTIDLSEHYPHFEGTSKLTATFPNRLFTGGYVDGHLNCRAIMNSFKEKINFSLDILLNDFLIVDKCTYEVEIQPDGYFNIAFNEHFFLFSYPIFADKISVELFVDPEEDKEIEIYILETPATIGLIPYAIPERNQIEEVCYDDLIEDVSVYDRDVDIWRDCRDLEYEMICREIGF